MSKIDIGSFERVRSGFTGTTRGTLVELSAKLKRMVEEDPGVPGVTVGLAKDGVRLDLDTAALFAVGSAVLRPHALDPIRVLLDEVRATTYSIDIEGHTDDQPLFRRNGNELETNWSLSGRRASTVAHYLIETGFDEYRLRIVGYASTRAKVPVEGMAGEELEEARAVNRRVSLLIR